MMNNTLVGVDLTPESRKKFRREFKRAVGRSLKDPKK
jgi:hypothetical protein